MGVRDYARKTGFQQRPAGPFGRHRFGAHCGHRGGGARQRKRAGRDDALPHSSKGSVDDSVDLASNLGIQTLKLPIAGIMQSYDGALHDAFAGRAVDVTEENIQLANSAGNLLTAPIEQIRALLGSDDGNKSELSVGYCTLYGYMSGGLALVPLDLPKMMVYRVARWRNQRQADIPEALQSDQGALGGAAAQPDRPGFATAI